MTEQGHQESLWHESIEDALRSVIDGVGGFKKVGAVLWPALPVDDAGRKLAKCLHRERPEKLSYDELLLILRLGREEGVHVAMAFIAQQAGYETPQPSNPQTEHEKLQRDFVRGVQEMSRLAKRLEQLEHSEFTTRLRPVG